MRVHEHVRPSFIVDAFLHDIVARLRKAWDAPAERERAWAVFRLRQSAEMYFRAIVDARVRDDVTNTGAFQPKAVAAMFLQRKRSEPRRDILEKVSDALAEFSPEARAYVAQNARADAAYVKAVGVGSADAAYFKAVIDPEDAPVVTCLEAALYHLQRLGDRARHCGNPECPAPYFIAQKKGQKYCSPECAAPSQRESKRKWWNANRTKEGG